MRAYLAVIKDSFREAIASRVLLTLLVLISVFFVLLAPIGFDEELVSRLQRIDIKAGTDLVNVFVDQGKSADPAPGKHIWQQLSAELKKRMVNSRTSDNPRESRRTLSNLVRELNSLMERKDFYDEAAWTDIRLSQEAEQLRKRGISELSNEELQYFNRLTLDAAFPIHVSRVRPSGTRIKYFGHQVFDAIPIDSEGIQRIVKSLLADTLYLLVGVFGVFVAILVTASVIPQMFEAGAIDLLLSKPVSRSLLFLTKFAGGCAFIVLHTSYFISGLWLIAGLRFDIWIGRLFLCIPVFLFLFAVYYSISALVGVVWKNTVMSIVMTIVFWGVCFTVGSTKLIIETFFLNTKRLVEMIPAEDELIVTNKSGKTFQWQAADSSWQEVFADASSDTLPFGIIRYPLLGPIYDSQADRLVAVEISGGRFPGMGGPGKLLIGKDEEHWRRIPGVSAPAGVSTIFLDQKYRIILAGNSGIYRFEGDPSVEHVPFKFFGFDVAPKLESGKFVEVGPADKTLFGTPFSAAVNGQSGNLVVATQGKLLLLSLNADDVYEVQQQSKLADQNPAVAAISDRVVVVASKSGEIKVFNAKSLQEVASFKPFASNEPKTVVASPNGRWFGVLYHHRKLWLYDAHNERPVAADVSGQGDISAVAFSKQNRLLVADRFPRVIEYDPNSWALTAQYAASPEILEWVYLYLVEPVYTVFPKPAELNKMVAYLLTDQQTEVSVERENNLEAERIVFDIWQPIWSNLAFLGVVLCLSCVYVARRDF